jgi:hypothetical protein
MLPQITLSCQANKRRIMRLRAKVSQATGATAHRHATLVKGSLVQGAQTPAAAYVEITEGPPGFSLLHLDADGRCVADTWHPTIAEAMDQAKFEFKIEETDWVSIGE